MILALGACRPLFDREASGTVLGVAGATEGTVNGKTTRLTSSSAIAPNEKITSSASSRIDLMLLPGVLVELQGESEIEITELQFRKDGDELIDTPEFRKATLRLSRGTLLAFVGRARTRSQLSVETAAGVVSASSGRTFRVELIGNKLRAFCVRGKINFQPHPAGSAVKIEAGSFAEFPSARAAPRAAAQSGPQAQGEAATIVAGAQRLRDLERAHRSFFTPWRRP